MRAILFIETDSSLIAWIILGITFIFMLKIYVPFFKNRRDLVYLLDLSVEPITLKRLGYIMHEIKQNTRIIEMKKSGVSPRKKYHINNYFYDLTSDFKLFLQKKTFIIMGSLNTERDNSIEIDCCLTHKQLNEVVKSSDILSTLNKFVSNVEESKLQEFKNVAKSSQLVIEKIEMVKHQIVDSMSGYAEGLTDGITLFCDAMGLDIDDIDYEKAMEVINNKHLTKKTLSEADLQNMLGNKKKKLSIKRKKEILIDNKP